MEVGIKNVKTEIVTEEKSAASLGSGLLPVYATPAMIAFMENTAHTSVAEYLQEGQGTVGILINVKHVAPTPLGMEVRCESELIEVDHNRLVFEVKVYDEAGLIGEGIHERFTVDNDKFMGNVEARKK
jgi:fluoroacetyl-CoA thioesterase